MRIYYVPMKILFAAISITAVAAAVMLFVLAAIKSRKAYIGKAVICCCIFAASAVGFALSSDTVRDDKISEVHVTVSPVKGTEAPEPSIDPTLAPSAPAQAQGAYEQAVGRISFICRHARRHRAYPRIIAYGFRRATRQLPPDILRAESAIHNKKTAHRNR